MKGYEKLDDVLARAFKQASQGKGKERHANDLPFHEQPMQQVNAMVGVGFSHGQAIKKIVESQNMAPEQAVHELLGAICYLAGSIITLESANDNEPMQAVAYSDDRQVKAKMHEYLDENYKLQLIDELDEMLANHPKGWIKVPEGAMYFINGFKGEIEAFYDKDFKNVYTLNDINAWVKCWIGREALEENGGIIVWQREEPSAVAAIPKQARDQAREILSKMVRGEVANINGVKVTFDSGGFFCAKLKGFLAINTTSLNTILEYLFQELS